MKWDTVRGIRPRLARDISGGFGSTSYAKEELVAELSAVFVQADLGVQIGSKQFTKPCGVFAELDESTEG